MNFGFTEEQELLRDQVRRFLDQHCPMPEVRKIMTDPGGFSPQIWQEIADLGWLGLVIPAEHGGVGMSWVDLIIILEETGRSLFPSPLISQTLAASTLSESTNEDLQKTWLPEIASGRKIATIAILDEQGDPVTSNITLSANSSDGRYELTGTRHFVADAGQADLFLVAFRTGTGDDDLALALVEADDPGVTASSSATMDQTKRTGSLSLDKVKVTADEIVATGKDTIQRLLDKGAVAVTAEIIGAAEAVLDLTTGYARERVQFDNPIGKYQGVKHRLAEIYVDIESFKSLLYYAAWTVDNSTDELPRSASLAKGYASESFARIGIDGVHLHGAIGFTTEYDMQLYLKRSKWARAMFGDSDFHYERAATMGDL